ncbi:MAG: DUF4388 domain-containing protein [Chitinispirillaceae bacterium]|nr:DUF4388 domain-containing protein [Chitinispirillaceae bacterium]
MTFQSLIQSAGGIAAVGFASGFFLGLIIVFLIRRLRMAKHAAPQFTTRFMYSGNLKQTNLLDAIQFLEMGRREGILHIYVGRRKGYIAFSGGRIVDAFFRNTTGKEGIFVMLELEYGDFYFESKILNQPPVMSESIMDIALEWDARKYAAHEDQGAAGAWDQQAESGAGDNPALFAHDYVPPLDQPLPDAQGYDDRYGRDGGEERKAPDAGQEDVS